MTELQARELAAQIEARFPHTSTVVVQSVDMRNAPRNWFIAVHRKDDQSPSTSLHIHNKFEWLEALDAFYVLSA